MANSAIFPIYLRTEYRSDGLKEFVRSANDAANKAKREFEGVGAALDRALKSKMQGGTLDLGVDEMRRAAEAQQQIAAAARQVAAATARATTEGGRFNASLAGTTAAANALAMAEEAAAREALEHVIALEAVQRELDRTAVKSTGLVQAGRNVTQMTGAQRAGMQQLSFQINDIATMYALGARPMQIFASQAGQVTQAIQLLTGGTSRLAAFLSGPWGLAVTSAAIVLTPFVAKLFETGAESDKAGKATQTLAEKLDLARVSYELAIEAAREYNAETARSAQTSLQAARAAAINADKVLKVAEAKLIEVEANSRLLAVTTPTSSNLGRNIGNSADDRARQLRGEIEAARQNLGNARFDVATEQAAILSDPAKAIKERFAVAREEVRGLGLDVERTTAKLVELNRQEEAALKALKPDRSRKSNGNAEARRALREQNALARFADQTGERIARINAQFDAQPRLIDAAAQATRELDRIIAQLAKRKPIDWQAMTADAEAAKDVIQEAVARPFDELMRLSEQRLQIEGLIAAGRLDEALALQEILRLEQQIGSLTAQQRQDIRDQIRFEQDKTRELRAQAELLAAQANVARVVADDLRDLLSGRATDFFGNFQQALKDLQGARLFESLFGPAFRALEQELAGNTPQGRANARYVAEVEKTASTTTRLESALSRLADATDTAAVNMRGGAANDNGAGFNPRLAMAMAGLSSVGLPGITVNGTRPPPAEFAQKSIKEIAREISREAVKPGVELLSRLIGREIAGAVGNVVAGVIEGQARGGTTGAILGGLEQLTGQIKGLEGISSVLGKALDGAQTGSQVAGITAALGLPSNSTGAQIGGALGSAFGPVGSIVGAVAGNFLGALIAGIPKGSATINGVGVTSVVGNRGSLREAAGGLGGSVNDLVAQVAKQLGGRINAAAAPVSIGIRDGDFRVDPTGRGITRIKGGAIEFGKDQEAAVRFATQLLIERGVIAGIKASEQRLLRAGKTIEDGLRDVLDFRGVFDRLREIRDPVGFAVERLNREFERLIDLFNRAGASAEEFQDLRDLYDLERARAIEEASNRVIGSLRSLLNELTIGNSGLSLRSRQQNALAQFDGLAARVAAGDTSAFDDFADISKQLLDIERQLFGSTQSYFDRLAQITALTEKAVSDQTNITSIASAQGSPFPDRFEIVRGIDVMTNELASRLDAIISNQIAVAQIAQRGPSSNGSGGAGGGGLVDFSVFPAVANF